MAVISEVLETPRQRKSKIVSRVMITDESLQVDGDLTGAFKFDILVNSMDQMPEIQVNLNILRG